MNKDLYNEIVYLPKELADHLVICFQSVPNADSNVEGYNRNQELTNSGYLTYQQMGRIKNWFDNFTGNKTDAPYILNGSDYMKNWINSTLDSMRRNDGMTKKIEAEYKPAEVDTQLAADMGWLADFGKPSQEHSSFVDDVAINEHLLRINELIKKII